MNTMFADRLNAAGFKNFYMFGEGCCRYTQVWYRDHAGESLGRTG